jgi:FkbM family methyltransferase
MKIRNKFHLPDEDTHFNGDDYQVQHRFNSVKESMKKQRFGTAIDVGAHVGTWAVDLARYFEHVICFEPILEHRECLIKNMEIFKPSRYSILPYALGDEDNKTIHLNYMSEGNSGTASIDTEGKYEAKLFTLDSFNYDKIDYLKVDIEGFELQFLKGATETIKRTKPVINIEIKNTCERFDVSPSDVKDYISDELKMICVNNTVKDYVYIYSEE